MIKAELNQNGALTPYEIQHIINNTDRDKISDNNKYFKGQNPTILDQDSPDSGIPDNRIPVPYARKVALTTKNYMFAKPVNYASEDKDHMNRLNEVFYVNRNERKINEIGQDLIVFGTAYKLFSYKSDNGNTVPTYSRLDPRYCFPVYDYSTDPNLVAFIYYYIVGEDSDADYTTYVNVYYASHVVKYKEKGTTVSEGMQTLSNAPHGFNDVPVVHYGDNNYELGVFDSIKDIIDGIDKIISTDLNEIEKFNLAYMILYGQTLDAEELEKIKEHRLFELDKDSKLEYLLKQVDGTFNGSVLDFLVDQVHKQSGVPDFASKDFAADSGIALLYKLIGFEGIASDFESIFIDGELRSIDLINSILYRSNLSGIDFLRANKEKSVEITMSRNLPEDLAVKVEVASKLSALGVSIETILDTLPMIKDVKEELKRIKKQKKDEINDFIGGENVEEENEADVEEEEGE